jgi:hypothetical protein
MGFRYARFKKPMDVVAKQRRRARRLSAGTFTFSHVDGADDVYINERGERYTRDKLKKWFGIRKPKSPQLLALEKKWRKLRRSHDQARAR